VGATVVNAPVAGSLSTAIGLPLSAYRREHVQSCLVRAMRRERIPDVAALIARVEHDSEFRTRVRRSVAVSTTGLFRDPTQLRWIDRTVMPSLVAGAKHASAWSAGCAGGEEAYTLAMMLEWNGMLGRSEVVGSDILEEALDSARSELVGGARIPAALRGRARWDLRDLTSDPAPRDDFNLVLCRNVMTYLTPDAAATVGATLAASLALGGVVVLARDERIEDFESLGLAAMSPNAYRRVE
jgi:chemotaxis protein methyltransferase CheR